ncbi:MAG: hypothetical protein DSM106950_37115 [Stigonema ocellatum SAG 48.90 = DSM 106950]|nr:hypothetical protein [Stigonema ocellatum SAG 48.90 = DSM 106950]
MGSGEWGIGGLLLIVSCQKLLLPTPYSLLPTPHSLLPTPYSPLPTPHSLLPTPHSPLPTPSSFTSSQCYRQFLGILEAIAWQWFCHVVNHIS